MLTDKEIQDIAQPFTRECGDYSAHEEAIPYRDIEDGTMNYKSHLIANMKVAIRCFVLMVFHALHGIIPCKYTSHDYWGI